MSSTRVKPNHVCLSVCLLFCALEGSCQSSQQASLPAVVQAADIVAQTPAEPVTATAWFQAAAPPVIFQTDEFDAKLIKYLAVTSQAVWWQYDNTTLSRIAKTGNASYGDSQRLAQGKIFNVLATPHGVAVASKGGLRLLDDQAVSSALDEHLVEVGEEGLLHAATYHQGLLWYLVTAQGQPTEIGAFRIADTAPITEAVKRRPLPQHLRQLLPGGEDWLLVERQDRVWMRMDLRSLIQGTAAPTLVPINGLGAVFHTLYLHGRTLLLNEKGLQELHPSTMELAPLVAFDSGNEGGLAPTWDGSGVWLLDQKNARRFDLGAGRVVETLHLPEAERANRNQGRLRTPLVFGSIAQDTLGRVWVSSSLGLYVTDPLRTRVLAETDAGEKGARVGSSVRSLGFTRNGSIWIGEDNGVRLIPGSGQAERSVPTDEPVDFATQRADGRLVIATASGVHVQQGAGWRSVRTAPKGDWAGLDRVEYADRLLDQWLRKPLLATQLVQLFSYRQLKYFDRVDDLLERLEPKVTRSALLSPPWASFALDAASVEAEQGQPKEFLVVAPWPGGTSNLMSIAELRDGQAERFATVLSQGTYGQYERIIREPATGDLFALSSDGLLRRQSAHEPFKSVPIPTSSEQDAGPLREALASRHLLRARQHIAPPRFTSLMAEPNDPMATVFIADESRLFRRVPGTGSDGQWQLMVEMAPGDKDKSILGLLPDPDGKGALVGCERCTPDSLFHVSADGSQVSPIPLKDQKIGAGDNALLRDSHGRTWLAAEKGLYFRDNDKMPFALFRRPDGNAVSFDVNSILEDRSGRIWLAAGNSRETLAAASKELRGSKLAGEEGKLDLGALYVIDKGVLDRKQQFTRVAVSLALQQGKTVADDLLWVCGDNLLLAIELGAEPKVTSMLSLFEKTVGMGEGTDRVGILRCAADADGMLVLSKQGLAQVNAGVWKPVELEEEFTQTSDDQRGSMLRTFTDPGGVSHGKAIVSLGDASSSRSKLWLRPAAGQPFEPMHSLPWIASLAALPDGTVLVGTEAGQVMQITTDGRILPRWSLIPHENAQGKPLGNFSHTCIVDAQTALVWGQDARPLVVKPGSRRWFSFAVSPGDCVNLGGGQTLFRYDRSVSLLTIGDDENHRQDAVTDVPIEGAPSARPELTDITIQSNWPPRNEGPIVLRTEDGLYQYVRNAPAFKFMGPLPPQLKRQKKDGWIEIIADEFWLHRNGTIFHRPITGGNWQLLDEIDGIPIEAMNVKMLNAGKDEQGNSKVLLTGYSGETGTAAKDRAGTWHFTMSKRSAVAGLTRFHSEVFAVDRQLIVAMVTDQGCILIPFDPATGELSQSSSLTLDQTQGIGSHVAIAVHWEAASQRLFVASRNQVTALKVFWNQGRPSVVAGEVLAPTSLDKSAPILPSGEVRDMQVNHAGTTAWILLRTTGAGSGEFGTYSLVRWDIVGKRLINERLTGAVDAMLGPSTNDQTPRVLLLDEQLAWTLWQPATYRTPELSVQTSLGLWSWLKLSPGSLSPLDDDLLGWRVRYRIAKPSGDWTTWPLLRDPSLFHYVKEYRIEAELLRPAEEPVVYRASLLISQSKEEWLWHRFILLVGGVGIVAFFALWIRRYIVRRRRLMAHQIPYIQGESIQDAAKFFGRDELLAELRDGLANGSFALVGEFRIGKTSIQRQLTQLLGQVKHQDFAYIPIFIDMQHLGIQDEDRFFHFLGRQLVEKCKQLGVSAKAINDMAYTQCKDVADYDSQPFSGDLELALKALTPIFQPLTPILVFQIDEIALLKDFHPDTKLGLRAAFINQSQARVVLSGPYIPKLPAVDTMSPWWNFFREVEVLPLTPSEAKRLIEEPVRGLFKFDQDVIEQIIARAEGRPLKIQTLCAEILRQRYQKRVWRKRLTRDDLAAAVSSLALQRDQKEVVQ